MLAHTTNHLATGLNVNVVLILLQKLPLVLGVQTESCWRT